MRPWTLGAGLFAAIGMTLGFVATSGVAVRSSSAPAVVAELPPKKAPPIVVIMPPKEVAPAYDEFGPDPTKPLASSRTRAQRFKKADAARPAENPKKQTEPRRTREASSPVVAKKPETREPARSSVAAEREEQLPPAETLRPAPKPERSPSQDPERRLIEEDRRWRRETIDRWEKEERERKKEPSGEVSEAIEREFDESGKLRKRAKDPG